MAQCAVGIVVLLADRGRVVKGGARGFGAVESGKDPGGKILGGEAAACGSDVGAGMEGLGQDANASFFKPGLGRQVGAGWNAVQKLEAGQQQGAGALGADQLPAWVEQQLPH